MADEGILMHVHPPTSAFVKIVAAKTASLVDAFQFDDPLVTTWTFTNKTFRLDIKGNYEQDTPLLSLTSGAGQIVVDDVTTRILHLNVEDTVVQAALVPGCYVYDLVMTDDSVPPVRTQLMHGTFVFADAITGD